MVVAAAAASAPAVVVKIIHNQIKCISLNCGMMTPALVRHGHANLFKNNNSQNVYAYINSLLDIHSINSNINSYSLFFLQEITMSEIKKISDWIQSKSMPYKIALCCSSVGAIQSLINTIIGNSASVIYNTAIIFNTNQFNLTQPPKIIFSNDGGKCILHVQLQLNTPPSRIINVFNVWLPTFAGDYGGDTIKQSQGHANIISAIRNNIKTGENYIIAGDFNYDFTANRRSAFDFNIIPSRGNIPLPTEISSDRTIDYFMTDLNLTQGTKYGFGAVYKPSNKTGENEFISDHYSIETVLQIQ
jgi:hypothetical protein